MLGPALGLLGVGFANALAGQASKATRKLLTKGGNPLAPAFWEPLDWDDVALDAALGVAIFKVREPALLAVWWCMHACVLVQRMQARRRC